MTRITVQSRRELVRAVHERYQSSARGTKARISEEFASISGYHRKSAIRILNGTVCPNEEARGRCGPRIYDEAARQVVIVLWEAADRVCGKAPQSASSGIGPRPRTQWALGAR